MLTPDDLVARIRSGAVQLPASVEANYGASMLEWVRQTYDGRMDFGAVTTSAVEGSHRAKAVDATCMDRALP